MQCTSRHLAAILAMAVVFMGLLGSSCVTKRDIEDVNVRLDRIEAQTAATQRLISRMDSVMAASSEADTRLRNEIRTSVDDLQQQLSSLLENYNDLQRIIKQMGQRAPTIRETPTSSPGASQDQNSAACQDSYDSAFVLVTHGKYEQAIQGFQSYLQTCPRHMNVPNATYWIGECYYSLERFKDAVDQFESLLKTYPNSTNTGQAMYKLARSRQELGQKVEAKKMFQQIVDKFPNTPVAEQSKDRLKEIR